MKKLSIIFVLIATVSIGFWSLLWLFSSSSLASGYCGSGFDLFHKDFRCRQPYMAVSLMLICFISAIACLFFIMKRK